MKRLIDALEGLFAASAAVGGALAMPANVVLENVNWTGGPGRHEPAGHPVVEEHLEVACAASGPDGSLTRRVAEALLAVTDQLQWRAYVTDRAHEPDIAVFSRRFTALNVIGSGGLLPSHRVTAGFTLQSPDTYYPPHAHLAEESYWIIGGAGDWKVGTRPWFAVEPGDAVYHAPWARHAMQTNEQPLLTVWLWTSDLDSEVVFVRD
jgi:mannose-6-phosphate isomerase-like protein (cupin superfamily)